MPSVDKFGSQGVSKPKSFADMTGGVNAPAKPKPKPPEKPSFMSGIKSLANKLNLTGPPTAGALAAQKAFMNKNKNKSGGSSSQQTDDQAPDMTDQYAENLRRYNEYMESQQPQGPAVTPEMRQAALQMFESQQGAGQMPYYMAAAAQSQDPNMSPAFQYAAQNYGTLGGSQRLAPRPMEMMSVAERRQINDMAQAMLEEETYTRQAQNQYQQGMDTVMRGGGKGGPATMPQTGMSVDRFPPQRMPPNFGAILAQRFGRMY